MAFSLPAAMGGFKPACGRVGERMTTDASIAKQVIEDEIESQITSAKEKLEVLASKAEGSMVKAEVEAYEALMPKLQAIEQNLLQLKKQLGRSGSRRKPISKC
jgi:hypothetical protein